MSAKKHGKGSPASKPKNRFRIKFDTPEQQLAYTEMMRNMNKISNDGSKIGPASLVDGPVNATVKDDALWGGLKPTS